MIYPSHDDLVYLAGLLDGEGSIVLLHGRNGRRSGNPTFDLHVSVTNTHAPIMDWLTDRFGGKSYPGTRYPLRRQVWHWVVIGLPAIQLLHRLAPYLKIKQQQAWLAQEAWAQKTSYMGGRGRRVPLEEYALREGYARAMSYLNKEARSA